MSWSKSPHRKQKGADPRRIVRGRSGRAGRHHTGSAQTAHGTSMQPNVDAALSNRTGNLTAREIALPWLADR